MIHELRTYTLKSGAAPGYEKVFGERLPHREKHSKLGGFWHTEVGPLNQVIHLWPYDDLKHRIDVRTASAQETQWPPPSGGNLVTMESEIVIPAPFMRPLAPAQHGGLYELRIYTYQVGSMPEVLKGFGEVIEARETISPLVGVWTTEFGLLNRLYHMWAYKDGNDRDQKRAAARQLPNWSANPGEVLLNTENKFLIPAPFSPLR